MVMRNEWEGFIQKWLEMFGHDICRSIEPSGIEVGYIRMGKMGMEWEAGEYHFIEHIHRQIKIPYLLRKAATCKAEPSHYVLNS